MRKRRKLPCFDQHDAFRILDFAFDDQKGALLMFGGDMQRFRWNMAGFFQNRGYFQFTSPITSRTSHCSTWTLPPMAASIMRLAPFQSATSSALATAKPVRTLVVACVIDVTAEVEQNLAIHNSDADRREIVAKGDGSQRAGLDQNLRVAVVDG